MCNYWKQAMLNPSKCNNTLNTACFPHEQSITQILYNTVPVLLTQTGAVVVRYNSVATHGKVLLGVAFMYGKNI